MERTEPSLVPEWLKSAGANGNGNSAHHVQTPSYLGSSQYESLVSRQRNLSGNFGDHDSSRQSVVSDRISYLPSRRPGGNGEKESYQHARGHFNFGRLSAHRSFEGHDREREGPRRDWDWDRDRERDRILNAAGVDDRDRLDAAPPRWSGTGSSGRYEVDFALRRSQSMGLPSRISENGDKKITGDIVGPSPASLVSAGGFSSSIQKAAFDRNFPSLGSQERLTALQMSGAHATLLSPRLLRQGSFSKLDIPRALSPGSSVSGSTSVISSSTAAGGSHLEGGSAGLAASSVMNDNLPSNGVVAASGAVSMGTVAPMHAHSSVTMPKMAEALVQNPPRVRSPPQISSETQRLEELALKQSRQLIPMKPSLPKTMGSRDKSKTKLMRNVDVTVSNNSKMNQPTSSSQLLSSTYRPPFSPRSEVLKMPQGKLLVLKPSKEATTSVSSPKPDVGASAPTVSATGSFVAGVASVTPYSHNLGGISRKQKQLLDRRAMPITQMVTNVGIDGGTVARVKEGSVMEDKRALLQAQNRSDFFNALRRKAAINSITSENTEKVMQLENVTESSSSVDRSNKFLTDGFELQNDIVDKEFQSSEVSKSSILDVAVQQKAFIPNGLSVDISEAVLGNSGVSDGGIVGTSEEEEAAFLRSLGWEESTEEGEALTEEEINAFYQEHKRSTRSPSSLHYNSQTLRNSVVNLQVGSIGSVSSGLSSSDSDDEPHV
ncbi:hypothetical protein O6H91_11G062600 [Diphasiastrum complanatum]|uniref:Uncharacterized protein n=4 Tax=Diphasiastrum complanatum TaxID=34168 RepID=A0ACC2C9Q3_DIPCM|nr:hypothetical protein O6H91_11G062600 [Diphasiastrum complanatum]KAJ7538765.1 hypothetical protein O6H91_11G062600 [Diphasiastrum complanatum]KAJ7538768.1 hypothetical protein O6H91_11G062600 [Diphasiastrum complanatum]KAJ7538782.1 hypothetical protein O6H91_11G062600 [Diphasiastrum complanatum]